MRRLRDRHADVRELHAAGPLTPPTGRSIPKLRERKMSRALFSTMILAGALAGNAISRAADTGCPLPSEPDRIPAALDAAISGPSDKDRTCMKALLIPEARMMFVSPGADGEPSYRLDTLDDW